MIASGRNEEERLAIKTFKRKNPYHFVNAIENSEILGLSVLTDLSTPERERSEEGQLDHREICVDL